MKSLNLMIAVIIYVIATVLSRRNKKNSGNRIAECQGWCEAKYGTGNYSAECKNNWCSSNCNCQGQQCEMCYSVMIPRFMEDWMCADCDKKCSIGTNPQDCKTKWCEGTCKQKGYKKYDLNRDGQCGSWCAGIPNVDQQFCYQHFCRYECECENNYGYCSNKCNRQLIADFKNWMCADCDEKCRRNLTPDPDQTKEQQCRREWCEGKCRGIEPVAPTIPKTPDEIIREGRETWTNCDTWCFGSGFEQDCKDYYCKQECDCQGCRNCLRNETPKNMINWMCADCDEKCRRIPEREEECRKNWCENDKCIITFIEQNKCENAYCYKWCENELTRKNDPYFRVKPICESRCKKGCLKRDL